jgi:hypothetical protein
MRDLLLQIRASLEHKLYYLPDICGAIESKDGAATARRYKHWFDRNIAPRYAVGTHLIMTGEDCWAFRCRLLHQGRAQRLGRYSRVLFVEIPGFFMHRCAADDILYLDLAAFCEDMIAGAETWLGQVEGTYDYESNAKHFMTRYPNGYPPHVVGGAVIS